MRALQGEQTKLTQNDPPPLVFAYNNKSWNKAKRDIPEEILDAPNFVKRML